jgi:predicted nuclease with TOPRIM domain
VGGLSTFGESGLTIETGIALIIALVGAISGLYATLRKSRVEEKTANADATGKLADGYSAFADDLREEIRGLRVETDELRRNNRALVIDLDRLRHDLTGYLERIRKLEHENSALKQELGVEREKRRTEVKRLEACISDLEAQNKALRQENAELRLFYERDKANE